MSADTKLFARSKPCVPKRMNAKRQCRSPQRESAHSNTLRFQQTTQYPHFRFENGTVSKTVTSRHHMKAMCFRTANRRTQRRGHSSHSSVQPRQLCIVGRCCTSRTELGFLYARKQKDIWAAEGSVVTNFNRQLHGNQAELVMCET